MNMFKKCYPKYSSRADTKEHQSEQAVNLRILFNLDLNLSEEKNKKRRPKTSFFFGMWR